MRTSKTYLEDLPTPMKEALAEQSLSIVASHSAIRMARETRG